MTTQLPGDTRLLCADTGAEESIERLIVRQDTNVPVWSLGPDLLLGVTQVTHVAPAGTALVCDVQLASGRQLRVGTEQSILTFEGPARVGDLHAGARVAVPRFVPDPLHVRHWPDPEVILLAHMLGDGCFVERQPVRYTSADPENLAVVADSARHFGVTARRVRQANWWHLYLPAPYRLTHGRRNPIAKWLSDLGLYGLRSPHKFLPAPVFALPIEQITLFLRHLWATDGSVGYFGGQARVYYASSSRALVDGVQSLLLRLEIQSRIHKVQKAGYGPSYHLDIPARDNQHRFLREVGVHGERGAGVDALLAMPVVRTRHQYTDNLPRDVWRRVASLAREQGRSLRQVERSVGNSPLRRSPPSRARMGAVAELLGDTELELLAGSEVFWDRIVRVRPGGHASVYSVVSPNGRLIANGVFTGLSQV